MSTKGLVDEGLGIVNAVCALGDVAYLLSTSSCRQKRILLILVPACPKYKLHFFLRLIGMSYIRLLLVKMSVLSACKLEFLLLNDELLKKMMPLVVFFTSTLV